MTIAFDCSFIPRAFKRRHSRSMSIKPMLWRVLLYSRPGLPRPMSRKEFSGVMEIILYESEVQTKRRGIKRKRSTHRDQTSSRQEQRSTRRDWMAKTLVEETIMR